MKSNNKINGTCPFSHENNYINRYSMKVHEVGRKPRAIAEPIKGRQLPSVPEGILGIHSPSVLIIHIFSSRNTVLRLK